MRLRNRRRLKQEDLAIALGVSRTTIMNWETGRAVPRLTVPQVKTLCKMLGITLDELPDNFGPQQGQGGESPLRHLRECSGLSEADLARELSTEGNQVSVESVLNWEETGDLPSLSIFQVAALCDALGVSLRQLADYLDPSSSPQQEESEGSNELR